MGEGTAFWTGIAVIAPVPATVTAGIAAGVEPLCGGDKGCRRRSPGRPPPKIPLTIAAAWVKILCFPRADVGSRRAREVIGMPKTGEQPGVGLYVCSSCDQIVRLDDPDDALPPCPNCESTEYR